MDIARPGTLFVLGVNKTFFKQAGFEPVIRDLDARDCITALRFIEVPIYDRAGHAHAADTAYALCYRKG